MLRIKSYSDGSFFSITSSAKLVAVPNSFCLATIKFVPPSQATLPDLVVKSVCWQISNKTKFKDLRTLYIHLCRIQIHERQLYILKLLRKYEFVSSKALAITKSYLINTSEGLVCKPTMYAECEICGKTCCNTLKHNMKRENRL